jgi:antitoxin component of RelBE/YafQ-DinJ toxin-antitoxin module
MKTKQIINVDEELFDKANQFSLKYGISLEDLINLFLKEFYKNKDIFIKSISKKEFTNGNSKKENLKIIDWHKFDKKFDKFRKGLPLDYQFNREIANER